MILAVLISIFIWGWFVKCNIVDNWVDSFFGAADHFLMAILSVLILALSLISTIFLSMLPGMLFEQYAELQSKIELVSIRDKDGVGGSFFLGSGSIDGKPYYFYYKKLDNGGFSPGKVEADDSVRIYEESRSDTALLMYNCEFKNKLSYLVGTPKISGECVREDFYVPKGTIRRGFSI